MSFDSVQLCAYYVPFCRFYASLMFVKNSFVGHFDNMMYIDLSLLSSASTNEDVTSVSSSFPMFFIVSFSCGCRSSTSRLLITIESLFLSVRVAHSVDYFQNEQVLSSRLCILHSFHGHQARNIKNRVFSSTIITKTYQYQIPALYKRTLEILLIIDKSAK